MMRKPVLRYSLLVLAFCAMVTAPAMATMVNTVATGDMLAGSSLTVTFQSGVVMAGAIGAGPAALEGSVVVPGFFSFTVTGDTWRNPWQLTNLKPNDFILRADFFLDPSAPVRSLFDDDSAPSTPNSVRGRAGAIYVAGPPIVASAEYAPWADSQNMGDMFNGEWIQWGTSSFPFMATADWHDDTDFIPEPGTLCVLGIAGALAYIRRRRRA